jgi:hypothetical protein
MVDIMKAPHLAGVVRLDFGTTHFTRQGLEALIASPHLGGLRRLWLAYRNIYNHPTMKGPLKERFGPVLQIN